MEYALARALRRERAEEAAEQERKTQAEQLRLLHTAVFQGVPAARSSAASWSPRTSDWRPPFPDPNPFPPPSPHPREESSDLDASLTRLCKRLKTLEEAVSDGAVRSPSNPPLPSPSLGDIASTISQQVGMEVGRAIREARAEARVM